MNEMIELINVLRSIDKSLKILAMVKIDTCGRGNKNGNAMKLRKLMNDFMVESGAEERV